MDRWLVSDIFLKEKSQYSLKVFEFYNMQHKVSLMTGPIFLSAHEPAAPVPHTASKVSCDHRQRCQAGRRCNLPRGKSSVKPGLVRSVSEMSI